MAWLAGHAGRSRVNDRQAKGQAGKSRYKVGLKGQARRSLSKVGQACQAGGLGFRV